MEKIHHKPIKRFGLEGKIHDDADLPRLKTEYVKLVLTQMRLAGYVPKFDEEAPNKNRNGRDDDPGIDFACPETTRVYVGKKKSNWILGIYKNRVLYYHQSKQRECSSVSESISKGK